MSNPNRIQKTALTITRWVGSPVSVVTHTLLFAASFFLVWGGWLSLDRMLLVLTTIVSLEAIYLAIFIQMTLNYTVQEVEDVGKDIDEIQENIDEMQEDVEEIQEDVDELQEDVEDISEDDAKVDAREAEHQSALASIQNDLKKLMQDIEKLQTK